MQVPEFSELSKKIGLKMNTIRSGSLKGVPSMFDNLSEEARLSLQKSLSVSFNFFLSLVKERRNITDKNIINSISTGKIFVGREALENSLIDQIGDEQEALAWLEKKNITGKVEKINLYPNSSAFNIFKKRSEAALIQKFLLDNVLQSHGILAIMPGYSNIEDLSLVGND